MIGRWVELVMGMKWMDLSCVKTEDGMRMEVGEQACVKRDVIGLFLEILELIR